MKLRATVIVAFDFFERFDLLNWLTL